MEIRVIFPSLGSYSSKKRQKLIEERKAKKEQSEGEKPSKEERLKAINSKLDHQIETKRKMKSILNDEQYAKWEEKYTRAHAKKRMHKKRGMKKKKE